MPGEALTVRATLVAGIVATKVAATRAFMRRSISDRRKVLRYAKKILHQRYAAGINIMFLRPGELFYLRHIMNGVKDVCPVQTFQGDSTRVLIPCYGRCSKKDFRSIRSIH